MDAPPKDTLLRCSICGTEREVNFAQRLRIGWPKCCGATMTVVETDADIDEAVRGTM